MKRLLLALVLIAAAYGGYAELYPARPGPDAQASTRGDEVLAEAYAAQRSDVQVQGQGVVTKVLADDNDGSRHQRFIVQLGTGQSVLIAHNIDLAPRIPSLAAGAVVAFHGEYEWNPKGGVVHWTHHDPDGRHVGGWLKHAGQVYQ